VKVISFLTSEFVDDLLLTKSEENVLAGEAFDIDFKRIQNFSWPSLVLSVYVSSVSTQGVPGGMYNTLGECSLCYNIPI
jgi:hypothetical protein